MGIVDVFTEKEGVFVSLDGELQIEKRDRPRLQAEEKHSPDLKTGVGLDSGSQNPRSPGNGICEGGKR